MRVWNFFKEFLRRLQKSDVSLQASGMAFSTVIAFIPWIAISLSLLRLSGATEKILKRAEPMILDFLLSGTGLNIIKQLQVSIERVHSGVLGIAGIIGMVITTFKLFHDFDKAQSRIWEIEETRSFWKRILIYMLLTFSVPVSMALIFGVLGPKGMALFQEIPRDYVAVFFIWITLFSIFKWWPIKNVETHTAFIGSVIVMGLLSALEESYAWLFKKFFKFGKVYGSLASVPMFLVWLQLIWLVILVGIAAIATYTHYRESKINPHKKIIKKGR